MKPFVTVTGAAAPLLQANIDTDVIIRIERLTEGADLGRYALEAMRYRAGRLAESELCAQRVALQARADPARRTEFRLWLVARRRGDGIDGDGRALRDRAELRRYFSRQLFSQRTPAGRACLKARSKNWRHNRATVTLPSISPRQVIVAPSREITTFSIDPLQRDALLEGLDEIGLTLKCADEINAWQDADRVNRPWVWQTGKVRL